MKRIVFMGVTIIAIGIITVLGNLDNLKEYIIEKFSEQTLEQNEIEEQDDNGEWNSARMDFYHIYMEEPTTCVNYEDCYALLGYMIVNNIELYEFTIDNPDYIEEEPQILTDIEVTQAYEDITLVLNTYTDLWSGLSASAEEVKNEEGEIIKVNYVFTLYNKDGMEVSAIKEKIEEANQTCIDLINEMYESEEITSDMNDKEKAYVLFQWFEEHVSYAYDSPSVDSEGLKQDNFYEAIVNEEAVCQGITGAYVHMCRLAGIDAYEQLGYADETPHSWCKVWDEDYNEWRYIDPTWGISNLSNESSDSDKWFWVTREFMENDEVCSRVFVEHIETE